MLLNNVILFRLLIFTPSPSVRVRCAPLLIATSRPLFLTKFIVFLISSSYLISSQVLRNYPLPTPLRRLFVFPFVGFRVSPTFTQHHPCPIHLNYETKKPENDLQGNLPEPATIIWHRNVRVGSYRDDSKIMHEERPRGNQLRLCCYQKCHLTTRKITRNATKQKMKSLERKSHRFHLWKGKHFLACQKKWKAQRHKRRMRKY